MTRAPRPIPDPATVRSRLLAWYDGNRRSLPWRAEPGETPDPYRVWLSEIMLQQTTVKTVQPYFENFVRRWPTVRDLAASSLDEVLHAWQGLGYYARARNLHRCAGVVADVLGGRFPDDEAELRELPGVGAYTAAAIAAIAFGRRAMPVDGNVERVTARLHAVADPLPKAKGRIARLAAGLTAPRRAGDFAQAVMDLGATVCTARAPDCAACPLRPQCRAADAGDPARYPVKAPKKTKPRRHGVVFWAVAGDGRVLMRKRSGKGLLGGLMEFPSSEWRDRPWTAAEARRSAPVVARWRPLEGAVRHTFTHFHLELSILAGEIEGPVPADGTWCRPDRFGDHALPTVMKKVARHVRGEGAA